VSIDGLLLGAIVGALFFVPVGYIIRLWVSRATDSVARPPGIDDIYESLASLRGGLDQLRSALGTIEQERQLMASKLQLMSTEMADFFDKTRKSEERQRGLTRRAEAAIGDEENTELQDQQLLELMDQQQGEPPAGEQAAPMTREQYYRQQST